MYCNPDYQTCDPPDEPSPPDDVLYVLGGASHYDSRPVQLGHKGDDTWLIPIPEGRAVELAYTHGETDNTVGHRLESTESVVKGRIHYLQMKVHWWFNAYLSANYGIVVYLTKTKNVQQIQPVVKCDTALVISACEGNISGIIFDSWWDNASGD